MKQNLSKSEKAFLEAIRIAERKGTLAYLPAAEAKKYGQWARAQLKDARINLRISSQDLAGIKALAAKAGKKYQTFLGEMIHREAQKAA
jgi:hypothetical protein